jgi:hypothetical protein
VPNARAAQASTSNARVEADVLRTRL